MKTLLSLGRIANAILAISYGFRFVVWHRVEDWQASVLWLLMLLILRMESTTAL
jgi:hypothetical protein